MKYCSNGKYCSNLWDYKKQFSGFGTKINVSPEFPGCVNEIVIHTTNEHKWGICPIPVSFMELGFNISGHCC